MEPSISCDGRTLLLNNSNDPAAQTDIYRADRIADDRFRLVGRVPGLNASGVLDAVPSQDDAGRLYFVSTRRYDATL